MQWRLKSTLTAQALTTFTSNLYSKNLRLTPFVIAESGATYLTHDVMSQSAEIQIRNYNQYLGESGWDLKLSERLHAEASRLKSNTNIKTGVVAGAFALADLALLKIYLNKREEDPQKAADFIVNIDLGGQYKVRQLTGLWQINLKMPSNQALLLLAGIPTLELKRF